MRLTLALVLTLLSGCASGRWSVLPTTYYVATTGNDSSTGTEAAPFRTIQKAVGVVRAGDTVLIRAGSYPAFELRNKNGAADAPITFKGESGAIVDRHLGGGNGLRNIEFYGGSYVTIDGLELTDSDPEQEPVTDCSANRIPPGKAGIKLNRQSSRGPHPHHLIFKNLHIHDLHGTAIGGSSDYLQFLDNHVHHNGDIRTNEGAYGTYLKGKGLLIRRNRIHDNNGNGIRTGNDPSTGISELLTGSIIENNLVYNNGGTFAHPSGSTGCRIITGGDGIVVWHGSANIIRNNIVSNNVGFGIRVNADSTVSDDSNLVYNNTVYKNGKEGIYSYAGHNTVVKNNISYLNSGQEIFGGIQSNNLTTDPNFVNAAGGDFRLHVGSPAIDAGVTLSEVLVDMASGARPSGSAYDAGVLEFNAAPDDSKSRPVPPPTH